MAQPNCYPGLPSRKVLALEATSHLQGAQKIEEKKPSILLATLSEEKNKGDKTQTGICDNRAGET